VIGARYLIGDIDASKHKTLLFPATMTSLNKKPYAEVSVGLENILKFFRVDAVWRLTDTKISDVDKFMVMFSLQVVI
jgi:hypothetical protein